MLPILKTSRVMRALACGLLGLMVMSLGFPGESATERRQGSVVRAPRVRPQRLESFDISHHGADESAPVIAAHGELLSSAVSVAPAAAGPSAVAPTLSSIQPDGTSSPVDRLAADVLPPRPLALPSLGRAPPTA